jgi:hypothetical protein
VLESFLFPGRPEVLDELVETEKLGQQLEPIMKNLEHLAAYLPLAVLVVEKELKILGRVLGYVEGG